MNRQQRAERTAAAASTVGARCRTLWWDLAFGLGALSVICFRFAVLRRGDAPATVDAGNWLAFADGMLGEGVRSSTIVYPPLVPLLTKASVAAFGLTDGIALLAALSSLMPAAGVYITLRRAGLTWGSLAPALLVATASSVGEATAWGGFPQLIALGLTPIALILLDRFLRTWATRHALAVGLTLMAILATSHMLAAVVTLAAVGMTFGALLRRPDGLPRDWRSRAGRLALVLLPSVWLAPLYWVLAGTFAGRPPAVASPNHLTWTNLLERVEFLYRDSPWLWRFLLPMALVAPIALWRRHRTPLWRTTSWLMAATVILVAVTREERFLYVLTPAGALGLALWTERASEWLGTDVGREAGSFRPARAAAVTGLVFLVTAVAFQSVRSADFFEHQRAHYGILTPGLVEGIRYLGDHSSADSLVAVTSLNNAPLGWWVEAIARRPTLYGSPLHWLVFDDEIERASIANDVFAPPFPTPDKLAAAEEAGIGLILLPLSWTFYDESAVERLAGVSADAVVRVNDSAVVIRLDAVGG